MSQPSKVLSAAHPVLDPRTLGRPVHLLAAFADKFGADLSDLLRLGLNRRYGTQFTVGRVLIVHAPAAIAPRWNVYGSATGRIGVALERSLVLRVLHCRYGLRDGEGTDPASAPMTATEERLAQKLGLQLALVLAVRIREGLSALVSASAHSASDDIAWRAETTDAVGAWTLQVRIDEPQVGLCSELQFSLDSTWMDLLLGQLAAARSVPRSDLRKEQTQPFAQCLRVRLVARLLHRRMALGEVLDLRPGDIIPVSFQAADVLVKDSRLFTATVAEHKGGLWLTAFNDTL
ncbi:FliM/FliN family flagellar motor switch protein [Acidovorax sp. SRB_24]|uniref:FliM/FliN family flagellar motor switch protein n=1 Tax=Acidovorax sp. SRB_24 TaxID=1962700 RepID=UPI00145EE8F1|nr:FliM/FliN family flagellar motor C-terminal domain-containing protein [Acidovorax sp. SRB_24]NMM76278.1 hypothetical protein [Acidovorax sp. SRB_24]NMM76370.1 hypothetical protein [Acidovorax sp. SRB_24]